MIQHPPAGGASTPTGSRPGKTPRVAARQDSDIGAGQSTELSRSREKAAYEGAFLCSYSTTPYFHPSVALPDHGRTGAFAWSSRSTPPRPRPREAFEASVTRGTKRPMMTRVPPNESNNPKNPRNRGAPKKQASHQVRPLRGRSVSIPTPHGPWWRGYPRLGKECP